MVDQRKYESRDARAIFIDQGDAARPDSARLGVLDAEQEAGRGQDGHHGLRDAFLERLARLAVDRLGDRHQAVERPVVDRAAEGPGREPAEHLAGILPRARDRTPGPRPGEEAVVAGRRDPVRRVQRPLDANRDDPEVDDVDLFLGSVSGSISKRQLVVAGGRCSSNA